MEVGLFFLLGTATLVAGVLGVRFNKRIARLLFVTALASFIVGGFVYKSEQDAIRQVVREFEAGKSIICTANDTIYRINKVDGYEIKAGEHFVKNPQAFWAKNCKAE